MRHTLTGGVLFSDKETDTGSGVSDALFSRGDLVMVELDADVMQVMQEGIGNWDPRMSQVSTKSDPRMSQVSTKSDPRMSQVRTKSDPCISHVQHQINVCHMYETRPHVCHR